MSAERPPSTDDLVQLYGAVGWTPYTADPQALKRAVDSSSYVRTVWRDDQLIGLCRALSDGLILCYLLDLLVHPDHQGTGIGKQLLTACMQDHGHVRQFLLLTDDRPEQLGLYGSVGLKNLADLKFHKLNLFLEFRGVELR